MKKVEKNMKRKMVRLMGSLFAGVIAATAASASYAGVSFALRADTVTPGVYVVYARSDKTVHGRPNNMVLGGQVTIILPDGAVPKPIGGGGDYKVTDNRAVAGTWAGQDVSQDVGAPDIQGDVSDVLQVLLSASAPEVDVDAGREIELFRFQLEESCQGEIRLLSNTEPFGADKPNSRRLASANVWETLEGEMYIGNYDLYMAPCPQ